MTTNVIMECVVPGAPAFLVNVIWILIVMQVRAALARNAPHLVFRNMTVATLQYMIPVIVEKSCALVLLNVIHGDGVRSLALWTASTIPVPTVILFLEFVV